MIKQNWITSFILAMSNVLALPCTISKEVMVIIDCSDYDALKQDWESVGKDLWYGIHEAQSEIDLNDK